MTPELEAVALAIGRVLKDDDEMLYAAEWEEAACAAIKALRPFIHECCQLGPYRYPTDHGIDVKIDAALAEEPNDG